ncbi:MAG: hypothetical protein R6U91_05280 [Bacillota bacterium]
MLKIKRNWFFLVVVLLMVVIIGAGCQGDEETEINAEADKEEVDDQDLDETIEALGVFEGQIDSQSVEIEVDGRKQAFALEEGLSVADIKSGTEVSIIYYETEDRPVLKEIKALEETEEIKEGEGIYNGQADSRSIEIDLDGRLKVFTVDSGLSVDHLIEGSKIGFTYKESDHGPVLLSIEVIEEAERKEEDQIEEGKKLEGNGILVGQVDSQSVEIARVRVFELAENISVEEIEDGSEVAFTYTEKEHRPVLETIEVVDEPLEGELIQGTYIGQVDSNSVEIEYHQVYALGSGVSREGIEDGAEISFTYYNDTHRPEIVSLNAR